MATCKFISMFLNNDFYNPRISTLDSESYLFMCIVLYFIIMIKQPRVWIVILFFLRWYAHGYSGGAPEAACPTQQPQHGYPPSPCCEGFSLAIPSATSWSAGQTIEIQLIADLFYYELCSSGTACVIPLII